MSGVSPLRGKLEIDGRSQSGRAGRSHWQGLSGGSADMCFLPHAKNRGGRDSFQIHRSPHQDRARRRNVSKLKPSTRTALIVSPSLTSRSHEVISTTSRYPRGGTSALT